MEFDVTNITFWVKEENPWQIIFDGYKKGIKPGKQVRPYKLHTRYTYMYVRVWLGLLGVTKKSPEGHNSVALPTAEGRREGDRICPALTETFMSLHGDLHSIGSAWT